MNLSSRFATAALAGAMGLSFAAPQPALADGAASTRNIIFGAAAIGGSLLVINHNKKVHQKFAEYDRRQAESESERNQAQAAYIHEKRAYQSEVALVHDLERQVAVQRNMIHQRDKQVASLTHSLIVAKKYARENRTASAGRFAVPHATRAARNAPPPKADVAVGSHAAQTVSYGWGSF
ncbi:MAG: hypothetical protein NVSMB19_13700 [Vulcanimicrobiaceae bacterium]